MFFGGAAFQATPMSGRDWAISVALGFVSIPLGFLIRCIPTLPSERLFIAIHLMRDPKAPPTLAGAERDAEDGWNPAIRKVRDQLPTLPCVRGARKRASSFVCKNHSHGKSDSSSSDNIGV